MKIILEFDDFHHDKSVNCIDSIYALTERYPNVIINLFTIPCYNSSPLYESVNWCSEVASLIRSKNLCIGVHGLFHTQEEFANKTFQDAHESLVRAHEILEKSNIEYTKVFRGPHWGICQSTIAALIDHEYRYIYSHKKHSNLTNIYSDKINFVYYNWNLKDNFGTFENSLSNNICVAHGHTRDVCGNGIRESMDRIIYGLDKLMESDDFEFLRIDQY